MSKIERGPRRLEGIVAELFAPLLRAQPTAAQWRLASWDVEQGLCVTLARDDEWVLVEFEERDAQRPCVTHTARFNVQARRALSEEPLSAGARRAVGQLVAMVAQRERHLPVLQEEPPRAAEVREIEVERVLLAQGPGHYYLNPYAGCTIGCPYCYVGERAALSRRLEGRAPVPWGHFVDVKVNAAEVLAREVRSLPPGIVRMSPILTDPYQPVEKKYRITRQCLEVLVGTGFAPVVLTRGARIQEDAALLARFERAAVGVSLPTDDDRVRAAFEPRADPVEERLAALEACHRAGVRTMAVVQPLLPMNPERLAERLAPIARSVRVDRMHELEKARPLYEAAGCLDAMSKEFADRTERELRAALERRGVRVDPLDDLERLFH